MKNKEKYSYSAGGYSKSVKGENSSPKASSLNFIKKPFYAFSFLALVGALAVSVYLAGENQDVRQLAGGETNGFTDLTFDQSKISVSDEATVKVVLTNLGTGSTENAVYPNMPPDGQFAMKAFLTNDMSIFVNNSNFTELFSESSAVVESPRLKNMPPKSERAEEVSFTVPVANYKRICTYIDSLDQIAEVDEENNVVCLNLPVN